MNKHHIFDLDGTAVDSIPAWSDYLHSLLKDNGILPPENFVKTFSSMSYDALSKYLLSLGVKAENQQELISKIKQSMYGKYRDCVPLKPYFKELCRHIIDRGGKVYILTAGSHVTCDICLKNNGVIDYMSAVWCAEDFEYNKSQPELYHAVARKIGVNTEEIDFYDDCLTNIETAKKAGINTTGVYNELSFNPKIKDLSDRFIKSFKELL